MTTSSNISAPAAVSIETAIRGIAQRICEVLDEERNLVAQPESAQFQGLVERKGHLAIELARLLQHAAGQRRGPQLEETLRQLAAELDANMRLLRRHIEAVSELSTLIADAVQSASSDGTYSRSAGRKGANA